MNKKRVLLAVVLALLFALMVVQVVFGGWAWDGGGCTMGCPIQPTPDLGKSQNCPPYID